MGWQQQMRSGMFRDVPFRVLSQDSEGGRRVARHEYPGRDDPWPEDLGRKGRSHNIDMHIVGDDYMTGRDAMLAALEKAGPAQLVHPWLGQIQVQVETYRLRETSRQGGMATFSISFVEAGKQQFPTAGANTAGAVATQGATVRAVAQAAFVNQFTVAGKPAFVAAGNVSVLQQMTARIASITQSIPGIPAEIGTVLADVSALNSGMTALVQQPATLASNITSTISGLSNAYADPFAALNVYKRLGLFGKNTSPHRADHVAAVPGAALSKPTPARRQQAINQTASINLTQQLTLAGEAEAASRASPASSSEALALRDDLTERIDAQAVAAGSDDEYNALTDLRVAVARDLNDRAADLPRLSHITTTATQPALVLAHRHLGDARREIEIVARNKVRHPGFVPGGRSLELLTTGTANV